MNKIILLLASAWLAFIQPNYLAAQTTPDTRVYELRIYETAPGRLDDLVNRFRLYTRALFERHGMENVGYWLPIHNEQNLLPYILAYPNREAATAAWAGFRQDTTWQRVRSYTERAGKIVNKVESIFMRPTDFSPPMRASYGGKHVFEYRVYTAAPGKMDALLARFRNHTMRIFEQNGMTNVAYWTTLEKEGEQPRLVYLLAHKSEKKAKRNWEKFGRSKAWKRVIAETESNGSLVQKIESVYWRALPFSAIQ